jgi:5-methylcytosine-specific restriction endonuclease McrA
MSGDKKHKWCSRDCYRAAKTVNPPPPPPVVRRCHFCNVDLPSSDYRERKWCSQACARHYRQPFSPLRWAECHCGQWYVKRFNAVHCPRPQPEPERKCRDCGEPRRKWTSFCDACRDAKHAEQVRKFIEFRKAGRPAWKAKDRARRRGAKTTERVDPAAVFARDGYKCQICGGRLAMKQPWPHPKSPTIDHIVPVARGGSHTLANVQAAHMICNSKKGAGGTDQLRLIG